MYICAAMEKFELHILGCGSALPTTRHFATSQVVNLREKLFMIDCGEGAQMQLRRSRLKFSRLNHIFISHLHGDHCFGLLGLISTFGLLGRTADLHIHSPKGLEELFAPLLSFFCKTLAYKVFFHEFETKEPTLIYDDRSVAVTTIPLRHRIPCCGFLFEEKQRPNHIIRDMVDFYKVPVYELNRIKNGADFVTPEGEVIPNHRLTRPSAPARKYAYCSDTIYRPEIVEQIKGIDLLFHLCHHFSGDTMFDNHAGIELSALFDGAGMSIGIEMHKTKAGSKALQPFEVIHKAPVVIAGDGQTTFRKNLEMLIKITTAEHIIIIGRTVFGDVNGQFWQKGVEFLAALHNAGRVDLPA